MTNVAKTLSFADLLVADALSNGWELNPIPLDSETNDDGNVTRAIFKVTNKEKFCAVMFAEASGDNSEIDDWLNGSNVFKISPTKSYSMDVAAFVTGVGIQTLQNKWEKLNLDPKNTEDDKYKIKPALRTFNGLQLLDIIDTAGDGRGRKSADGRATYLIRLTEDESKKICELFDIKGDAFESAYKMIKQSLYQDKQAERREQKTATRSESSTPHTMTIKQGNANNRTTKIINLSE